jgi:hypothetical protein
MYHCVMIPLTWGVSSCDNITEEKGPLSCQTSVLDFLKLSSWICASPSVLLDDGDDDPDDSSTIQEKVPPL